MVAKLPKITVWFGAVAEPAEDAPPYLVYANTDFSAPEVAQDTGPLLRWVKEYGSTGWNARRTIRFLKKHQQEFRECLEWLSENCPRRFKRRAGKAHRKSLWEKEWPKQTELQFFQRHTLVHGHLQFLPLLEKGPSVTGLVLSHKPKDPVDTICWYLLSVLSRNGTIGLRRCRYRKCGKFFRPPTVRRVFCRDSCRAMQRSDRALMSKRELEQFREDQRDYMKKHRKTLEADL